MTSGTGVTRDPDSTGAGKLVPLRKDGTRPPLFCIHPAEGYVKVYEKLVAALPTSQPAYGIQSGLLDREKTYDSIDAMALEYTGIVRQQTPRGPYRLLGFSLGGFIAMSMAHILEAQGERVEFVGLIDCDIRWADASFPRNLVLGELIEDVVREELNLPAVPTETLADDANLLSNQLMDWPRSQRPDAIVRWLADRRDLTDIPTDMLTAYLSMIVDHLGLIDGFQPEIVTAPVFVWKAAYASREGTPTALNWDAYAKSGTVEQIIEASHHGLMRPPAVDVLAARLDDALQSLVNKEEKPSAVSSNAMNMA